MIAKQISVFIENKTGRINDVTRILGENNINMQAFSLAETSDFGILRLILSNTDLAIKVLKEANFAVKQTEVVCLKCPDEPGALNKALEALAKDNIFIEYMYAFTEGEKANVVIRPTNIEKCIDSLKKIGL